MRPEVDLLAQDLLSPGYRRALRLLHRHLQGSDRACLSGPELARLLRGHGIKSFLEIGPGNSAFLRRLAPVFEDAGVEVSAVGLALDPFTRHLLAGHGVRAFPGDGRELGRLVGARRFDLIFAVGVLSLSTVMVEGPAADGSDRVKAAAQKHLELLKAGLKRLSRHSKAALIACSPVSFLILDRAAVEAHARVLVWEIEERKRALAWLAPQVERFSQAYSLTASERRSHAALWRTAADGILLTAPEGVRRGASIRGGGAAAPHSRGGPDATEGSG